MRGVLWVVLLLASPVGMAAEFVAGLSMSQVTLEARNDTDNKRTGEMINDQRIIPVFAVRAFEHYFGDSQWGVVWEFAEHSYLLEKQRVDGKELDLGTKMIGYYWHVTPTLFYRFNKNGGDNAWQTSMGFGVGVGYLDIAGTMVMTEQSGSPTVDLHDSGYTYSMGFFVETRKNDWLFQLKSFGPILQVGDYEVQTSALGITAGKIFDF